MKLALSQMSMSPDMEQNYQASLDYIRRAAEAGADLILFPEIQLTPFFPQYPGRDVDRYVLRADSPYLAGFSEACRRYHISASPNVYLEERGKRYDTSFLIDDTGAILGRQKMVHIAEAEQFYEQSYYTPSDEGFFAFDTKYGKIGIVVCFDRHYSESIRTEALRGADLILIPTANTTSEPSELFAWEIRVQAFQNSVNVAMCNRVGREGEMTFSGESLVCGPDGSVIAQAGKEETLLFAEVDLAAARELRRKKPYTSLRRPVLYE